MAQFDSSMYRGVPAVDFGGIADGFERGMKLGEMIKDNRKKSAIEGVYKNSMKQGPDGQSTLDPNMVTKGLGELGYAKEAQEFQDQQMERKQKKLAYDSSRADYERMEVAKRIGLVKDQESQDAVVQELNTLGIDTSMVPKAYNPSYIEKIRLMTLSPKEQMTMDIQRQDLEAKRTQQAFENKIALEGLNLKKTAATAEAAKPKLTPGQEAQDKNYGVEHSEFTSVNEKAAVSAIDQLKKYKQMLEDEEKAGFLAAGGGRASSLPDFARQQKSIEIRDGIRSQANKGLKGTFGGNPTEGERKAAAEEFYNDKLNNKANKTLLSDKIAEMEAGLALQRAKSKYFKENGTLRGFDGASQAAPPPPSLDFNKMSDDQIYQLYIQNGGK